MPKGKRRERGDRGHGGRRDVEPTVQSSEDEMDGRETVSVVSNCSETPAARSTDGSEDQEVDDSTSQDNFEDKLKELIEGTSQKSAKVRVDSLVSLRRAMDAKYIYDFIEQRKLTICDCIERCLKKGKSDEQAAAAMCAISLLVQLGSAEGGEEVYLQLLPTLKVILADASASCIARAACAEALGLCTFISCDDLEQITNVMTALENTFRNSYCKGDGSVPNHTPEVAALHTSALLSWMLLVSALPSCHFLSELIDSHLSKLPDVLRSADVDMRIAAGEAIALLYEIARAEDEDYEESSFDSLCLELKNLSTESNKYRAKKDRRQQRSSFRDILHSVEKGDFNNMRIRVNDQQTIVIRDWTTKTKYDALCHALGTGMKIHLQENELLRDIFDLGPPLLATTRVHSKASKTERHAMHDAAFKARTTGRSKMRDKKQVACGGD